MRFVITALVLLMMPHTLSAEWKLVWADEFDTPGLPDPARWGYEEGYVRNKEVQYYTRERAENARVENGMLILEARKDNMPNPKYDPAAREGVAAQPTLPYTAASITTKGKAEWTYGRVEVRAKLPQGKGVWPALWMLGTNIPRVGWPRSGEIDIMEFVGHSPGEVHGTMHWGPNARQKKQSSKSIKVDAPYDDFHVYAIEWYPDRIDVFFDDTRYHSFNLAEAGEGDDNPFRKPFYLLLNFALGGSWGREVDDSILPQQYLIDYVRVYQQAEPAAR